MRHYAFLRGAERIGDEKISSIQRQRVDWIGEIPEGWEKCCVKNRFNVIAGATPKSENSDYWDGTIPWITPADYTDTQHYVEGGSRFITEDGMNSCATTLVPENSIIISNRAPIGRVAIAERRLCTNQGCKALVKKDKDISSNYYYWYLNNLVEPINSFGKGTTFLELSASDISYFQIPLPSVDEQIQIADYLDSKTAEIDSLIADPERSIELLEEYRRSVISEAVTKGLEPTVPMKDSGVEWIGEIPEGWTVIPFRRVAIIAANLANPSMFPDLPQISPENIEKGTGKIKGYTTVADSGTASDNHLFYAGQILYSKVRPELNKVAIAPCDGMCSADMYPINTRANSKWLLYFMISSVFMAQVIVSTNRVKRYCQ